MLHDFDRAMFEAEGEAEDEYEGLYETDAFGRGQAGEFGETDATELALASELLEITTEEELDRFLGNLVSNAVSAARAFAGSDTGRAVGGVLKNAARRALPQIGQTVGNALAPGAGGAFGQRAGQWLGSRFELGLETEGLSPEDREYEAARAFVRFANETVQRAARAAPSTPPAVAARRAATAAAQQHLPGLVRTGAGATSAPRTEGRWVRRGNRIILLDA